jgi:hypothetical protein
MEDLRFIKMDNRIEPESDGPMASDNLMRLEGPPVAYAIRVLLAKSPGRMKKQDFMFFKECAARYGATTPYLTAATHVGLSVGELAKVQMAASIIRARYVEPWCGAKRWFVVYGKPS